MFRKTTSHLLYNFVKTFSMDGRKVKGLLDSPNFVCCTSRETAASLDGELCLSAIQKFSSESTNKPIKTFNYGAGYTMEEKNAILETINTCTVDELKRYSITEAKLKKITAYRDKIGFFKTIDDVLLLQGIDIGVLDKFCKSIVKYEAAPKNRGINTKTDLLTPPLDEDIRIAIETCTGIWVRGDLISWAQLNTNGNLLHWDCQSLEGVALKDGLVAIVESVARIVSKVPSSHVYIMESDAIIPFARMNSKIYYLHLQRQQIVATIASILGKKEQRFDNLGDTSTLINNIYIMRSRTPARLYNLLIGSETVSAEQVVEQLITNSQDNEDDTKNTVYADSGLMEYYKSRNIYEREQMNWSLLLTTAFINLSVMKTTSLKKISKHPRKKES